jgi:GAF domain-containing protein
VPDHIISKPGKLTPEEFQKMKVHPVVGAEILERVRFPFPVAPIVRCHHEKWDGSGYPAGLKGEDIPIGSRILTAVDCLDALASDRQYRRALPLDQAMAAVERDSGRAFDPRVVEVLKRRYTQLEQLARSSPMEAWRLSTDVQIEKGGAPGAGFAESRTAQTPERAAGEVGEFSDLMRLKLLLDAVNSGERFLNFGETLSIVAARLQEIVPFDAMAVYVPRGATLKAACTVGMLAPFSIPRGQGVSGWAMEANRPILNANAAVDLCYSAAVQASAPGSALAMPLPGSMGPAGVLTMYGPENGFDARHLETLSGIAAQLGGYLEKYECEARLTQRPPAAPLPNIAAAPPVKIESPLLIQ